MHFVEARTRASVSACHPRGFASSRARNHAKAEILTTGSRVTRIWDFADFVFAHLCRDACWHPPNNLFISYTTFVTMRLSELFLIIACHTVITHCWPFGSDFAYWFWQTCKH